MTVSTVTIFSLPDGVLTSDENTVRPAMDVEFTGGTGPFDVRHEWDDNSGFTSPIEDLNTSVTSIDRGIPPSDLFSPTTFYRVTVIDRGDEVDEI